MDESTNALEQINAHRQSIDQLDTKLVELLNERAGHSLAIRKLKPYAGMNLYDPSREESIMSRLVSLSEGPLNEEDIREIYATLLKVMKAFKE